LHDVTAQRDLARQREEFFANASHDLRTPVATIKGAIEVLLANAPSDLPEPLQRMLAIIGTETTRMTTLANDLLELARLNAELDHLQLVRHDLRHVARQAAHSIEPLAHSRQQQLSLDLPAQPVVASVDALRLERALVNLLANAQKYGHAGGSIRLSLENHADEAVFTVADDGPGIPHADQARIFARFFRSRTPATRCDQGSGLGLPIARAIAELHRGRLWVQSAPDEGASFSLAVPLAPMRVV
jgi:signal transduction histidine kinase